MNIEYKGFTICFESNGVRIDSGRYYIQTGGLGGCGFNTNGYATLNNAKGAITKYVKAEVARIDGLHPTEQAGAMLDLICRSMPATSDDKDRTSLSADDIETHRASLEATDNGTSLDGSVELPADDIDAFMADLPQANLANMTALFRYHGLFKQGNSDKRSRNKREGHLDGYVKGRTKRGLRYGKPLMLWSNSYGNQFTRKQRKQYNGF